jgi:Spy/CpxP family protein refolding chaperone
MYFKPILVSLLFVLMPLAGFGQKTPSTAAPAETQQHSGHAMHSFPFMGMGSPRQVDQSLKVLQQNLALTDSQVSQIRQLVNSRRDRFESIREQAAPKFRELMALLDQPNPDPTAVGKAAIAFKQAHDQARTEQANLEKEFLNVLNDNQRRTVNSLRNQAPEFMALYRLGFLRPDTEMDQQAFNSGR